MNRNIYTQALLVLFSFFSFQLIGQNSTIKGKIIEAETGNPVPDVTITIKDTDYSTKSDLFGDFMLETTLTGLQVLIIKKEGFEEESADLNIAFGDNDVPPLKLYSKDLDQSMIPVIALDDSDLDANSGDNNISGLLSATSDVFLSTAAFTFGPNRFRIRGYDSQNTTFLLSGTEMNDPETGRVFWSIWGGLNDVLRNRETTVGLGSNSYAFGGIGGATQIDVRATKARKQTKVSYAAANRSYRNRAMAVFSTGLRKDGWAFTVSASRRWADEGYVEGTSFDGYSYFVGIGKRLNDNHELNLTAFAAPTKRGSTTGSTLEMYDLAGTNFYNPFWGYQDGKKRNSRVTNSHQPVVMLNHDWKIGEKTTLNTAIASQFGRYGKTYIDWFDGRNPDPTYYRRLPSYIQDPVAKALVADKFRNDVNTRQVDWAYMYDANGLNNTTIENANGEQGNTVSGLRSNYILEERRYDVTTHTLTTLLTHEMSDQMTLTLGGSFKDYTSHNFKTVEDLLGGDFYLDINRFLDGAPDDPILQNDINNPNNLAKVGDVFGYDFDIHVQKANAWLQGVWTLQKFDFHLAANVTSTTFWREGYMQNGLFPDDSFGESDKTNFFNYGVKAGTTIKFNNRNYFNLNGSYSTRAPFTRNVFESSRSRDFVFEGLESEIISSAEAVYILNTPFVKARAGVYFTEIKNQVSSRSLFFDQGNEFVNFFQKGIDSRYVGMELGIDVRLFTGFNVNAVAAVGQYLLTSRPQASIIIDETTEPVFEDLTIYSNEFFIQGTPQTALSLGFDYNSPNYWWVSFNANYFDRSYLDFYPLRRTADAVAEVDRDSELFRQIIDQDKAPSAVTLDFFGGKSWLLNRYFKKLGDRRYFLMLTLGVNNFLDNKEFITGGFEQYRFDFEGNDLGRFPNRYFYQTGRNFFANLSLRF